MGWVSSQELWDATHPRQKTIADEMGPEMREVFLEYCQESESIRACKDPEEAYKKLGSQRLLSDWLVKNMRPEDYEAEYQEKVTTLLSGDNAVNYSPAGSRMWRFFFNPMGMYTFMGEYHWATKAALMILRTEIIEEGTKYNYHPSVQPDRLMEVDRKLKEMNIFELAVDTMIRFMTYANVFLLPETNGLGKRGFRIKNLQADKIWPIYSHNGEELEGYEYQVGTGTIQYDKDEILHLRDFSLKSRHMGSPRLSAAITDVEADLAASALSNAIMQKAGMIGVIIALEDPALKMKNPMRTSNMQRQEERMQKSIQGNAGIRGAHSVIVSNYVRDVYKLTEIGSLDANFLSLRTEVAKTVCILLGVPPERLAIPRTASAQYQAASVENILASNFDKHITMLERTVWDYINKHIIKDLMKIYDVEVAPRGRFSSNTINGARMAFLAAQTGPLFSVNEMRSWFFRVPELPVGDKRGDVVCDVSSIRDPMMKPTMVAVDDPRNLIATQPDIELTDEPNEQTGYGK